MATKSKEKKDYSNGVIDAVGFMLALGLCPSNPLEKLREQFMYVELLDKLKEFAVDAAFMWEKYYRNVDGFASVDWEEYNEEMAEWLGRLALEGDLANNWPTYAEIVIHAQTKWEGR